jgi:hypothetical protein
VLNEIVSEKVILPSSAARDKRFSLACSLSLSYDAGRKDSSALSRHKSGL